MTSALDLALESAALLDENGIAYALGGSLANSAVGEPRTTMDVDLAVRLDAAQLDALLRSADPRFYVPRAAADDAVVLASSFKVIDMASGLKVDLSVLGDSELDRRQIDRRHRRLVRRDPQAELWVTSPEDQILRKLSWFDAGGRVSDRQWRDVVGVLTTQRDRLDLDDMTRIAARLGLDELLAAALRAV